MVTDVRAREQLAGVDRPHVALEDALGWTFRDVALLERALSHRSYCAEHPGVESNERLEFLGDAVLGLIVTDYVFREFELFAEGDLAKLRAAVVNSEVLAEVASEVGLGEAVRLGRGEDASGGRTKPSILGDAMEAVIAAVYLDGGWAAARALVLRLVEPRIVEGAAGPGAYDYKGRLQELTARRFDQPPRYRVRSEGPDHERRFFATVLVHGEALGEGDGRSKKHAEMAAARDAWLRLRDEETVTGADGNPPGGRDAGAA